MLSQVKQRDTEERRGRTFAARRVAGRMPALLASLVLCLPLTACTNFFQCEKASCPTTGSGSGSGSGTPTTNTGDFAYVANSVAGTTYLSEYSISSNALNSLGSLSLGYIPVALAVAPSNSFLYVASVPGIASPGIYLYSIGSTGTLTAANNGAALVTDTISSMAVSPDGNWLYTVNVDGITMAEYSVNTSTGALTLSGETTLPGSTCSLNTAAPVSQTCSVAVSPSKEYVVASLGASGDIVYSYTSANGISGATAQEIPSGYSVSNPTGDFSVALDLNNYAYIARTSSLGVYEIESTTVPEVATLGFAAGSVPRSVTLSTNYEYLYTADEGAGTVSGFGIGNNGSLTAITGSPFAGPANVSALAVDNTGGYMVAVGYDANTGVRLYSISASGVLAQVAQAGSGTSLAYPALVAMTH